MMNFNGMSVEELKKELEKVRCSRTRRTKKSATTSRARRSSTKKKGMTKMEKLIAEGKEIEDC